MVLSLTENIIILSILTTIGIGPAYAHGGGLDLQGCHANNKIGNWHCHRRGISTFKSDSGMISGSVTLISVGDGDTVRVTKGKGVKVTIRLACIDAPEKSQGASGEFATKILKDLTGGKSISLQPKAKDKYGRTVAEIYSENRNTNLQMIEMGAAYAY